MFLFDKPPFPKSICMASAESKYKGVLAISYLESMLLHKTTDTIIAARIAITIHECLVKLTFIQISCSCQSNTVARQGSILDWPARLVLYLSFQMLLEMLASQGSIASDSSYPWVMGTALIDWQFMPTIIALFCNTSIQKT